MGMVVLLHVQDRESQPKPSFTTGIQGGGHIPNITCKNENNKNFGLPPTHGCWDSRVPKNGSCHPGGDEESASWVGGQPIKGILATPPKTTPPQE